METVVEELLGASAGGGIAAHDLYGGKSWRSAGTASRRVGRRSNRLRSFCCILPRPCEPDSGFDRRIKRSDHGKQDAPFGWQVDHYPVSRALGGSDHLDNLRPLHFGRTVVGWHPGQCPRRREVRRQSPDRASAAGGIAVTRGFVLVQKNPKRSSAMTLPAPCKCYSTWHAPGSELVLTFLAQPDQTRRRDRKTRR